MEASFSADITPAKTLEVAKKHKLITDDIYDEEFLSSLKLQYITGEAMKAKISAYYKTLRKIKPSVSSGIINKDDVFYIPKK